MTPDHVGLVVPDLDAAVDWAMMAFGLRLAVEEPATDVEGRAIGLAGLAVRLRGALLVSDDAPGAGIELHEFITPPVGRFSRRVSDPGPGHIAMRSSDLKSDMARLAEMGVRWHQPEPSLITSGPYAGRSWIYGWAPVLCAVLELLHEPEPSA